MEEAYRIRTYRYRAFYSLDYDGNIERDIALTQPTLLDIIEQRRMTEHLYKALAKLSEKQYRRIYAHYFLGMSIAEIAKADGCAFMSVKESIGRGLKQLGKFFEENS